MLIKKLIFAPIFLGFISACFYLFKLILPRYIEIFIGKWGGLYELGILAVALTGTAFTFCIYLMFSQDIKFTIFLGIIGSLISFIFLPPNLAIVAAVCFFISLIIVHFNLLTNLTTYVNFRPDNIISSPIKTLSTLMLFSLSIIFYLYSNTIIQTQGFKIPDSMIDWAVELSLNQYGVPVKGETYLAQNLTQEQINLLKQNPQVLEQFGLKSSDIDALTPSTTPDPKTPNKNAVKVNPALPSANLKDIIKAQISDSLDSMVKPYLFAIPMILAFLFYSIVSFVMWIFSLFLNPVILLVFYIFEKTGFITFQKEMREVKKMVI